MIQEHTAVAHQLAEKAFETLQGALFPAEALAELISLATPYADCNGLREAMQTAEAKLREQIP